MVSQVSRQNINTVTAANKLYLRCRMDAGKGTVFRFWSFFRGDARGQKHVKTGLNCHFVGHSFFLKNYPRWNFSLNGISFYLREPFWSFKERVFLQTGINPERSSGFFYALPPILIHPLPALIDFSPWMFVTYYTSPPFSEVILFRFPLPRKRSAKTPFE